MVKSITLVFENCEGLTFEYPDIFYFDIGSTKEKFSTFTNAISKIKVVSGFSLAIKLGSTPVNIDAFSQWCSWQHRLTLKDITQINIEFKNGEVDELVVTWPSATDNNSSDFQSAENIDNFILIKSTNDDYAFDESDLEAIKLLASF